ncbi:Crp/Fnr family transcriptional regulator [Listeria booriae]|uniref:Crp/Fnr family transcriptional regulator n=1 Tax=Listeria booriae TaxID=1552123 RepID=UPI00162518FC|nr:Crp/Fnr family transcriptional regulator [Listeria booriae]MBC1798750.1 Crp/Fnr family transcriptional regulator [Listeria booriae]MBC1811559.1 Crp/Fnr family transcriptional regulator [Listeria booriae]MDT0112367.1 Crp/Fnr family transcriptional regulator [Listeria booriae]
MDFLAVHNLLLREPNLLLPLLELSNMRKEGSDSYQVKALRSHESLDISDKGKLIHVVKGHLLQQVNNLSKKKQTINAIWMEHDFIFHNVFQSTYYAYTALDYVELEIYDANIVLQELSKQPFFPDLLIDILKRQESQFYQYSHMLTKDAQERVIDIVKLLSTKEEDGYHMPKTLNYLLLSKCCQISPHTAKKAMQELELANKIICKEGEKILIYNADH